MLIKKRFGTLYHQSIEGGYMVFSSPIHSFVAKIVGVHPDSFELDGMTGFRFFQCDIKLLISLRRPETDPGKIWIREDTSNQDSSTIDIYEGSRIERKVYVVKTLDEEFLSGVLGKKVIIDTPTFSKYYGTF